MVRVLERQVEAGAGVMARSFGILRFFWDRYHPEGTPDVPHTKRSGSACNLAGMVVKVRDSEDRRATLAQITPAGAQALRSAAPIYLAGIHEHFSRHLQPQELESMRAGLEHVLEATDG